MDVNKKILEYLKKERISQSELADKTGITQQNLNRLLNAENIKVSQMLEITKALMLPSTYFIDGKVQASNDEIEWRNKRIAELEEMLKDKKRIIDEREDRDKYFLLDGISSLLDSEFKNIKPKTKKEILIRLRQDLGEFDKHVGSPIDFTADKYVKPVLLKQLEELIKKIESK
ncbi:MAG: helix-turn-helix transcriptional regulator [Bacteroidota bacterium]